MEAREVGGTGVERRAEGRDWPFALTGLAFIVFLIAGFVTMGESPTTEDDSASEIVAFYVDNESSVIAGVVLLVIAAFSLVFFGGYLRKVLSVTDGLGDNRMFATLAGVGTTILAVGAAIDATITAALVAAADDIDPTAVQALQALWDNDFIPIALGILVFLLSTGIAILRSVVLPRWLGWVAIALFAVYLLAAATGLEAAFVVASFGSAIWVATTSVMLAVRGRRAAVANP